MKIGAVVRTIEDERGAEPPRCPSFAEICAVAQRMEAGGLDSIWLFDHLLYRYEGEPTVGIWECWTLLSALAALTQRVELGALVLCAQFRNPALLAKMASTLDEVSGGRLILGIGAGWNEPEFDAFGIPFDHRLERFHEALQIIAPLLREGHVDFDGRFYQARNCELLPRGPRPDGLPILVGAFGPRMIQRAVEYGTIWNGGYCGTIDTFAELLARFEEARTASGKSASDVQSSALIKVGWPDLAQVPEFYRGEYVTGSAAELGAAFEAFARAGVAHVMCQYHPNTHEALERLISGVRAYRDMEMTA